MSSFNINVIAVGNTREVFLSSLDSSFVQIDLSSGDDVSGRVLLETPNGLFFSRWTKYFETGWKCHGVDSFYPWHAIAKIVALDDPQDDTEG